MYVVRALCLSFSLAGGLAMAASATKAPAPAAPRATASSPAVSGQPTVRVLIKAGREARIASQMSGRITSLPLKLGQSFQKGGLLVGFECDHQEAELAAADAQFLKAEKTLESRVGLAALKAVSDLDVQLAQADLAQAKAQRDRARASVRDCRVLAPYGGSVVRVLANQWESVAAGTPLLEIVERGNLHVEALVQSSWLTWLRPGSRFQVRVDELGSDVAAEVTGIGAKVDPVSQTVPIAARIIGNVPGLRAGMSGNAIFAR